MLVWNNGVCAPNFKSLSPYNVVQYIWWRKKLLPKTKWYRKGHSVPFLSLDAPEYACCEIHTTIYLYTHQTRKKRTLEILVPFKY